MTSLDLHAAARQLAQLAQELDGSMGPERRAEIGGTLHQLSATVREASISLGAPPPLGPVAVLISETLGSAMAGVVVGLMRLRGSRGRRRRAEARYLAHMLVHQARDQGLDFPMVLALVSDEWNHLGSTTP